MSRSAWTGIMSYGMVNIPSSLVPVEDAKNEPDVIRLERSYEEIREKNKSKREFKLHQFAQQQHFFKTQGEFKSIGAPADHVIQIHGFVAANQVNPVCFGRSFVLVPDNNAVEAAALLVDALSDKEVIGLGTINLHKKPSMCAIRSTGGMIRLETLLHLDELNESKSQGAVLDPTLIDVLETFEDSVENSKAKHDKATAG